MKKKILLAVLFGFMIFGLTGCFSDTGSDNNDNKVQDLNGNAKTTFNVNETAVHEGVNYTVTNVEYSNGDEWDTPADGKQYVIVTIKIENKSESKISYNVYDWKMLNSQGQEDDEAFSTIDSDTNLSSGDLAVGGTKTGTIVFEEPKDETSLKLQYYSNSLFDENSTFEIVIK